VSGKAFLDYAGVADLSAVQGQFGTLLLDPENITIVAGANNPPELAANDAFGDPGALTVSTMARLMQQRQMSSCKLLVTLPLMRPSILLNKESALQLKPITTFELIKASLYYMEVLST
jgi:hypothetical protein